MHENLSSIDMDQNIVISFDSPKIISVGNNLVLLDCCLDHRGDLKAKCKFHDAFFGD